MSDSTVSIVGNLTRDPELRYTPAGKANCTIGVAVNKRWQNRQTNEWEERVSFFNVVMWDSLAENVAESCTKGQRVVVVGTLDQRSWETTEGDKRSTVEIKADEVGPSMRWATATVVRNERKDGQGAQQAQRQPAMAGGAPAPEYGDDEPF